MDKTTILNTIKNHYGFKKDSDLARFLGISPQTFCNWKKRNSYSIQRILMKFSEINPEWLLTGEEPMLKAGLPYEDSYLSAGEESSAPFVKTYAHNIPLYDLESNGGLKNVLKKNSAQAVISNFIKIPNLVDCDGATYIKGDSMHPLLKNGDMIVFKSISPENIFWGELYLVEIAINKDSAITTIRHIRKSELGDGYIKLVSENPVYEPKDVPVTQINAIALIRASIRFH
ncbi:MAG: helix-turn-helix domain-containing protein [Flavobacteriaceae bacterium]|nr:helix-turn-helix domain-containing protein [Flavobacteriaceae bacterium]